MKRGPENAELLETLRGLDKAYSKSKKRAWKRLAELLSRPRRRRVEVNLYDIEKHCPQGGVAVVPGKVLSLGTLSKKVTVVAFTATSGALSKMRAAGSKFVSLKEFASKGDLKGSRIIV